MPVASNGTHTPKITFENDRDLNIKVDSSRMDENFTDVSTGINSRLDRQGRNTPTANISWGSYKITNLGDGTASGDAVNLSQLDDKADDDLGNVTSGAYATTSKRGIARIATTAEAAAGTDDNTIMTPAKVSSLITSTTVFPPKYISDFIPVYVDTTTISCAGGSTRDAENTLNIVTDTTYSKDMSTGWEEGNGGGTASGAAIGVNDTFHMFVIAGGTSSATAGSFITDDISSNLTYFQSVSDGYLSIRVDSGAIQVLQNLDFSLTSSLGDVAQILDNRISTADVSEVDGVITFTSKTTGSNSSFEIFASDEDEYDGTDIYGTLYLDGANGETTQGEPEQAGVTDYGFDTDIDAANLMADSNVVDAGFDKYRRIASFITDEDGLVIPFIAIILSGGGIDIRYTTAPYNEDPEPIDTTFTYLDVEVPGDINFRGHFSIYVVTSSATRSYEIECGLSGAAVRLTYNDSARSVQFADMFVKTDSTIGFLCVQGTDNIDRLTVMGYEDQRG